MEVNNRYITVAYKLYAIEDGTEDKEPIEECGTEHPYQFISKMGLVLPRFEDELQNLSAGAAFDFVIPCKDAYGEVDDTLIIDVDKAVFMIDGKIDTNYIYEGSVVMMQGNDGSRFNATILEIKSDKVTIDLNHPRAGMDLHFVGTVVVNRPSTTEEITEMFNSMNSLGGCGGCGGCGGGSCEGGCGESGCGSCGGCGK